MNQSYANFFQSIIDQDRAAVVICNLEHEIIYMNPAAVHSYEKHEYRNAETMNTYDYTI